MTAPILGGLEPFTIWTASDMVTLSMTHDPRTEEWHITARHARSVIATPRWRSFRPDVDAWWQFVRGYAPDLAVALRGDEVRRDFSSMVATVQSGCACGECRNAVESRRRQPFTALDAAAGRAAGPVYELARARYVETGADGDMETMLACVTLTVPDLDSLGRDWGPSPKRPPRPHFGDDSRAPRVLLTRQAVRAGLAACVLILLVGYLISLWVPL